MGKYYNRSYREVPPYGIGNLVMLHGNYIRTRRAAKKLDAKLFGLFKAVKLVGMSVELEFPQQWRVHNAW